MWYFFNFNCRQIVFCGIILKIFYFWDVSVQENLQRKPAKKTCFDALRMYHDRTPLAQTRTKETIRKAQALERVALGNCARRVSRRLRWWWRCASSPPTSSSDGHRIASCRSQCRGIYRRRSVQHRQLRKRRRRGDGRLANTCQQQRKFCRRRHLREHRKHPRLCARRHPERRQPSQHPWWRRRLRHARQAARARTPICSHAGDGTDTITD